MTKTMTTYATPATPEMFLDVWDRCIHCHGRVFVKSNGTCVHFPTGLAVCGTPRPGANREVPA